MKSLKYIKSIVVVAVCALIFTTSSTYFSEASAEPAAAAVTTAVKCETIQPIVIVNSPKTYLNKKVTMIAKFDKFSTLGLDYKPAFKSSEEYISFLIKRDDTKYNIPLSEMKLFLKRSVAEKNIDLKTDDEIKIVGTVFSDALGDAWVDVEQISVIKKAPEKNGVK